MLRQHLSVLKPVILGLAALGVLVGQPAPAAATVIDFENLPSLPAQPNNFAAAGSMQTYTDAGVFSITGGVVLGNPTFLASFASHGSAPNLYGTADFADPSLLSTITLTLPSAEDITSVTGVLFNGQPISENYVVEAFSGATLIASQIFTNMAADSSTSGFGIFSFTSNTANPITSVIVETPADADLNGWDYFVDTINITASVTAVPEPSSALLLLGGGLLGLFAVRRRRSA
jgi:hypothetical protein